MVASPLVVSTVRHAASITTQLLGLAALAALLAAGAAIVYRQQTDQRVATWLAMLIGLGAVVVYLGTTPVLDSVVREGIEPTEAEVGLFSMAGVVAAVGGAAVGRRVGDRFCTEVVFWSPSQDIDGEVGQLAQTVGQVTNVRLPADIDDAVGYDPVPERTKEALAGTTFVFPRTLTTRELRERLEARLRSDYGVETVDAEFDGDEVAYLAVGRRATGIGSTLPSATNAVAVRADPAFSASTGDIVQVWEPQSMRRVLTGELRGVADDVVTVAIDATDTPKVDPTKRYRLVTLPVDDRPDREFASLLRAADETFSSATVEAGSPLHGMPVGALDLTVVAVRPEDDDPAVFPEGSYRLRPGDRLFVTGTAPRLRRLDHAGEPLDPSVVGPPTEVPDDRPAESIETADPSPTDPGDQPSEPARIDSETGIERGEDAGASESAAPEQTAEQPTAADAGASDAPEAEADDDSISAKADEATFEEIKAEFEEDEEDDEDPDAEPVEAAAADTSEPTDIDPETASFDQLRDEFESGEAGWDEDEDEDPFEEVEIAFEDDDASERADASVDDDDDDDLVSLEEADISFEDDEDDGPDPYERREEGESALGGPEIDEDLQGDDEESLSGDLSDLDVEGDDSGGTDDLSDLSFEDDGEDSIFDEGDSLEDDEVFGDDDAIEGEDDSLADDVVFGDDALDEDDEDDEEGASSDGGGGGGKSFAELKDEFESGDADWEDDVSDSPGGDMRLDE